MMVPPCLVPNSVCHLPVRVDRSERKAVRSISEAAVRQTSVKINPSTRLRPQPDDGAATERAAIAEGDAPNGNGATMRTHLLVKIMVGALLYLIVQLAALYVLATTLVSGLFGMP